MGKNRSFLTETSVRYALALLEISKENSNLDRTKKDIESLMQLYIENKDFENIIKNPTYNKNEQTLIVKKLAEKIDFSETTLNFLFLLIEKRRIFFLSSILKSFQNLLNKEKGEVNAVLTSAKKLNDGEINNLSKELSKSINKKIMLKYEIDQNLIGGIKVQLGSLMIDTSIKNKLKKFEQILMEK